MASLVLAWVILCLSVLVRAVPIVYFPFNSQLPPATRISEPFSYTLSPQTFSSQSNISYALRNAPAWLSIDSSTGRLSGTPQEADVPRGEVVGIPVDIVATDDSGSATMTATLVVTRNPAPKVQIPLSDQIQQLGETSSPTSVVAYPASEFSFAFDRDTFSYTGAGINYYATSANSSPLPSWIKFDASTLTFTGTTPPFESLVQPPQKFDFSLVGSDIVGFSAVSLVFSIIVGAHRLTTDTPVIKINATRGEQMTYEALAGSIRLDGNPIVPTDVNFTAADLPTWLTVDEATLVMKGTPLNDSQPSNSTITFRDAYADTLDILVSVSLEARIFRETDLNFEVKPGESFSFDVEPYLWSPSDVELELANSQDWIDVKGLKIAGTAPKSAATENIKLLVKATSKLSGESETVAADVEVLSGAATTTADVVPSASPTGSIMSSTPPEQLNPGLIALAILLPLGVLFAFVILIICCRRRKKRESMEHEKKKEKISMPVAGSFKRDSSNASVVDTIKSPGDRRRSRFNSAVARMRQSRTLSTITGSRISQSLHRASSLWRSPSERSVPTSPSYGSSWLTEGVYFQPQHAQQASTSTYDGPSDVLSGSSGFLQGQRDDSFRSVLDVTIPSMEDEASSIQATPDLAYTSPWGEPSRLALDRSFPQSAPSGSDLASIPEQPTPLGSHPTHGRRFSPGQRMRKGFPSLRSSASQNSLRSSLSGSGRGRLARQDSQPGSWAGSMMSRPISRKSDSSPFFGGRSVVPSRNRYHLDSDSDSLESGHGTENWQTIRPPRDSLGIAYAELTRSSPFLKHTSSLSPRPLSIVKKESSGPRYHTDSRVGKHTPVSRRRSSSSNALSTGRWNMGSPPGEAGFPSSRPGYASSRASSEVLGKGKGLARYSSGRDSDNSDWVTEAGTVGGKGPRSRLSSSEDFRVFM